MDNVKLILPVFFALALALIINPAVYANTAVPGYMVVQKNDITIHVPVAIESGGTAPQGIYKTSQTPASGVSVSILYPGNNMTTLTSPITITGRAWSKGIIRKVQYKVNNGIWQTATGTAVWIIRNVNLTAGKNIITVSATDKDGKSATATASVIYNPFSGKGEWYTYYLPFTSKVGQSDLAFYTDTGFKIVVHAPGRTEKGFSQDPITNGMTLNVYDPEGRLYVSTITLNTHNFEAVKGRLAATFSLANSNYAPLYTFYFKPVWQNDKVTYSDYGGGYLHIKNLKVWLYEPFSLQKKLVIKNIRAGCASNDGYGQYDFGYFYRVYNLFYSGNLKQDTCFSNLPVISGKLVVYGDKEAPHIQKGFYSHESTLYATYTSYSSGYTGYGTAQGCPIEVYFGITKKSWIQGESVCDYNTIHNPIFSTTGVTNNSVIVYVSDDSGYHRINQFSIQRAVMVGVYGGQIKKAFNQPSSKVTVWIRGQGDWIQAERYDNTYIGALGTNWFDQAGIIYPIKVGTRYFYIDAGKLGLTPGWNTIEVKAEDWSGRKSSTTVGKIYYDTEPPVLKSISPQNNSIITSVNQEINITASDNYGVKKIEVEISNGKGFIDVNGNITGPRQWVTIRTAISSRQKLLNGNLVFHATTTKSVTLSFRLTDDAGNVKEYRVTYKLNTPPYTYLTSEKNNGKYNPLKNTGEFTATAYSPYGVSKVYLKLNSVSWLLMRHTTAYNWELNNPSLLFKPNAWNTITLHAIGDNGKSTIETTKFYYGESISWNFNTPSNRTGWFNYHLASTGNNVYLKYYQSGSYDWEFGTGVNSNFGMAVVINNKKYNIGTTGRWRPYSFNLTKGIYNIKFYEEVGSPGWYGDVISNEKIGEVKFGVSQPIDLKFIRKNGAYLYEPTGTWQSWIIYGAIDNVNIKDNPLDFSPVIVQLTSQKNGAIYTPFNNLGKFTATVKSFEPANSISLKLNNDRWVSMINIYNNDIATNNWKLNDHNLLFKPNAWNTVTLHAIAPNGKSTTDITRFYFNESIDTHNLLQAHGSYSWQKGYGYIIGLYKGVTNLGTTGGKWKLNSFKFNRGIYNLNFYLKTVDYIPGDYYIISTDKLGNVIFGVSQPVILQFNRKTWTTSYVEYPWYQGWWNTGPSLTLVDGHGAIDNVSVN